MRNIIIACLFLLGHLLNLNLQAQITEDNFAARLLGRDEEGRLLFGYARLPWVDYPVLYAKSVDGLKFQGNSLTRSHRFPSFHPRKYTFSFLSCRNVEISGNSISKEVLGKNILLEGTPAGELYLADDQGLSTELLE